MRYVHHRCLRGLGLVICVGMAGCTVNIDDPDTRFNITHGDAATGHPPASEAGGDPSGPGGEASSGDVSSTLGDSTGTPTSSTTSGGVSTSEGSTVTETSFTETSAEVSETSADVDTDSETEDGGDSSEESESTTESTTGMQTTEESGMQDDEAGSESDTSEDTAGDTSSDACEAPQIACGDQQTCINPKTSEAYCGASGDCMNDRAGVVCSTDETCVDGQCALACVAGEIQCGDTCIDPQTDNAFCGASGNCLGGDQGQACDDKTACVDGQCECAGGRVRCAGECIDPMVDNDYCGAKNDCDSDDDDGEACRLAEICVAGVCSLACPSGLVQCGAQCIDPQTNDRFCGASGDCVDADEVGKVCDPSSTCVAGECTAACDASTNPVVTGTLFTDRGDFSFADATASVRLNHRRDIDPAEDGCISRVEITVDRGGLDSGCVLKIEAEGVLDDRGGGGAHLLVRSIEFEGGHQCAELDSTDRGSYRGHVSNSWVGLKHTEVADQNVALACLETELTIELAATLAFVGGPRQLVIASSNIKLVGDFLSTAKDSIDCPGVACSPLEAGDCPGVSSSCFPGSIELDSMTDFTCGEWGDGEEGQGCTLPMDCEAGLTCLDATTAGSICQSQPVAGAGEPGCCTQLCDTSVGNACGPGQACARVPHFSQDKDIGICVPL